MIAALAHYIQTGWSIYDYFYGLFFVAIILIVGYIINAADENKEK